MSKFTSIAGVLVTLGMATGAHAQANLTGETTPPTEIAAQTLFGVAELAAETGLANIQIAAGQTLTNSVQNVAEGKTDIAAAPFVLPFLLSRGAGPYASIGPETGAELAGQLSVLYTYRFSVFGLSAYESANFSGWDAVEGATIYNGPPRGAALNKARAMARLAAGLEDGKGYTGLQVNWGQSVSTITEGSANAHILPMNFPDARHSQAASSGGMVVYSFPKDVFEGEAGTKFGRAPGSAAVVQPIEEDLFGPNIRVVSEDGNFRGYADIGGDVVNTSMDEELAYQLTKTFLDGLDMIKQRTPSMAKGWLGETDPAITGMCGPNPIKYHPGAVRAWQEAGYTLPECALP
ncbi:C4-dicarboxylate ABC transporter substrate-binding protein [Planktotalea sp.]|uniref:TAXI family TRAP transporter solute-binding subunit n=1 Tax=Planktotalea sp. TaxID=2029877 RepID=UPI0032970EC1